MPTGIIRVRLSYIFHVTSASVVFYVLCLDGGRWVVNSTAVRTARCSTDSRECLAGGWKKLACFPYYSTVL
jgi:hypothetical protein